MRVIFAVYAADNLLEKTLHQKRLERYPHTNPHTHTVFVKNSKNHMRNVSFVNESLDSCTLIVCNGWSLYLIFQVPRAGSNARPTSGEFWHADHIVPVVS